MKQKDLEGLTALFSARLEADKAALSKLSNLEQEMRKQLADLNENRNGHARTDRDPDDTALQAGADVRWYRWIDKRKGQINQDLAMVIAKRERLLTKVKRSFGHNEAANALLETTKRNRKRARLAKSTDP